MDLQGVITLWLSVLLPLLLKEALWKGDSVTASPGHTFRQMKAEDIHATSRPERKTYEGWKILRFYPNRKKSQEFLRGIRQYTNMTVLKVTHVRNTLKIDVMLSPEIAHEIMAAGRLKSPRRFDDEGICLKKMMVEDGDSMKEMERKKMEEEEEEASACVEYQVMVHDIGREIQKQGRHAVRQAVEFDWSRFHNYTIIKRFLKKKHKENRRIVRSIKIGKSTQDRSMFGVVIGNRAGKIARIYNKAMKKSTKVSRRSLRKRKRKWRRKDGRKAKKQNVAPIIMIEAGNHAREWITQAVATYFIEQLVKESQEFLNLASWIIIPVANPDGYEHAYYVDRMWRKNMKGFGGDSCFGVDLNRNYGHQWGLDSGSSSNPCKSDYRGEAPFSERETQNLRDLFKAYEGLVKVFVTLHNYGQYILYPWGYTQENSSYKEQLSKTADEMRQCISRSRGTRYDVGQSSSALYEVSGGIDDWMHSSQVPTAYTLELPDDWRNGFLTPDEEILPICQETYPAFRCLAFKAAEKDSEAEGCFTSC